MGGGVVGEVCRAEPGIQSTHIIDRPPTGAAQDSLKAVDTSGPQTDAVDQHSVRTHRVHVKGEKVVTDLSMTDPIWLNNEPVAM